MVRHRYNRFRGLGFINSFSAHLYYADSTAAAGLVSREERDSRLPAVTQGKGLRRLYTFTDWVWLRLLVYVKDRLVERGATNVGAPSARVISALRKIADVPPPASRLLFLGPEIYLLREKEAVCLTGGVQQQILTQILTDELA